MDGKVVIVNIREKGCLLDKSTGFLLKAGQNELSPGGAVKNEEADQIGKGTDTSYPQRVGASPYTDLARALLSKTRPKDEAQLKRA